MDTLTLIDFLAAFSDVMLENGLGRANGEVMEPDPVHDGLPVRVLFQADNGQPVEFPITSIGVAVDGNGKVISMVINTVQEGAFSGAIDQNT